MTHQSKSSNILINNALRMNLQEFVELTDTIIDLLSKESGHVGNLKIIGKLVKATPENEAIIIGDIHGDLESLAQVLKDSCFIEKINQNAKPILIFLGDYGDRGIYSPEIYYIAMKLKEAYPENVVLMRGNHEGPADLLAEPHDLPKHLQNRFDKNWSSAYTKLRQLFVQLYTAVLVEERYILLHGGVPSQAKSLEDVAYAHMKHPRKSHLEEILWNDPEEDLTGTYPSPRGAGRLFGADVTSNFFKMLNVKVLIRGHEPKNIGFKINHKGKILTLFSRKGEPYYNYQGAYLHVDLNEKIETAYQLLSNIKTF
jgi:protein phosphatase